MTLDLPRRFSWPTLLFVATHDAIVAGLLYTSVHQVIEQPPPTQPIETTMVAPVDLEPPPAAQPVVEPVVEPDPEPEPEVAPEPPKEAPVVIHKPEPKPKPKPEPKPRSEKEVEQPRRDMKPATEPRPTSPFENNNTTPACIALSTSTAVTKPTVTVPSDPRTISRVQPTYPARAQALYIEGMVWVKFDVTPDGRTDDLQIPSAQPANMFEREVKGAMCRWRYEQVRSGTGVTIAIKFRLSGIEIN